MKYLAKDRQLGIAHNVSYRSAKQRSAYNIVVGSGVSGLPSSLSRHNPPQAPVFANKVTSGLHWLKRRLLLHTVSRLLHCMT